VILYHGCPVNLREVAEVFKCVLLIKSTKYRIIPVCIECKMNENVCMYEKNKTVWRPVTRLDADSWCVNNNNICYGCRGLIDNPAVDAQWDILQKYGLSWKRLPINSVYIVLVRRINMHNTSKNKNLHIEVKYLTEWRGTAILLPA